MSMKLVVICLISFSAWYYLNLPTEPTMNEFVSSKLEAYESERAAHDEEIAFSDMSKAEKIEALWGRE